MIEAGAAGVHYEDQLASVKKCGHMGGKVLVPTQEAVQKLTAARLAADVMGVPTVLLARTDAEAADIVTSDVDENDKPFITGERTSEGFYKTRKGFEQALSRGLAYAEYADMVWCETGTPDLAFARKFAEGIQKMYPGKMLAYNCSPSFNWKRNLDDATIGKFQRELGAMGYKFQFITLAGFHSLNYSMFELAYGYARNNAQRRPVGALEEHLRARRGLAEEAIVPVEAGEDRVRNLAGALVARPVDRDDLRRRRHIRRLSSPSFFRRRTARPRWSRAARWWRPCRR